MSVSYTKIVKAQAEREARDHPERDVRYYAWSARTEISRAINTTPQGEPINIIGHSLGGVSAIRAADSTNRIIDNLITIDPVQGFPGIGQVTLGNVGTWTNI
jgi:pimeloyl-ACP methyl ester carboxylesterase